MKRTIQTMLGIGCLTALSFVAAAQGGQSDQPGQSAQAADRLSNADSTFASKAAQGGLAEVELGKLAMTHATNDQVKQFGKQMVDDHGKANEELQQIASRKGITLPSSANSEDQATIKRLSSLTGSAFDKAYMDEMVKDHQTDVNEFRKESTSGQDSDFKSFASKTLPTLETHLKMAQDAQRAVGKPE